MTTGRGAAAGGGSNDRSMVSRGREVAKPNDRNGETCGVWPTRGSMLILFSGSPLLSSFAFFFVFLPVWRIHLHFIVADSCFFYMYMFCRRWESLEETIREEFRFWFWALF